MLALASFVLCLSSCLSAKDTLFTVDSTSPTPGLISRDEDQNSVQWGMEFTGQTVLLRVNSLPNISNPQHDGVRENNFLFSPLISNTYGSTSVSVSFTYQLVQQCGANYLPGTQCFNTLDLYLLKATQAARDIDMTDQSHVLYQDMLDPGHVNPDMNYAKTVTFSGGYNENFYVVFRDRGSSYLIKHLKVEQFYCAAYRDGVAECPRVLAQMTPVTVDCACTDGSSPSAGVPVQRECHYDGVTAGYQTPAGSNDYCACDDGYRFETVNHQDQCTKVVTTSAPSATSAPSSASSASSASTASAASTPGTSDTSDTSTVMTTPETVEKQVPCDPLPCAAERTKVFATCLLLAFLAWQL